VSPLWNIRTVWIGDPSPQLNSALNPSLPGSVKTVVNVLGTKTRGPTKPGVPVKLVVVPGGVHGADFGAAQSRADGATEPRANWPDYFGETVRWLDTYLKAR